MLTANPPDPLVRTGFGWAYYGRHPHGRRLAAKFELRFATSLQAGLTALHYAAASDNWQVIRILLDHGADPTAADLRGNTPLHYAAAFNSYLATKKLLQKESEALNINAYNSRGKAPIHLAAAPDSFRAMPRPFVPALALEVLLRAHANPMARDAEGNNPLHLAAQGGYVEIVRRLISFTNIPPEEKNAVSLGPC